ncbi:hypothetical protein J7T55_002492 [Diaporthe amygdali]|uniref:uncharacterized protein n=1 Tax=Phomopsis amygdali TaxID=1214568 RepID=UPI0022FE81C9|nr:uncharacterized protein J7T55_002492 [Diaporthe amygdali]KAJ0121981.1 hypothetical protein J7T55_002492 [Diaporthe amygdali]
MAGSICDACRAVKFENALQVQASDLRGGRGTFGSMTLLDEDVNRFDQASGTDCSLCQLLASTLCSNEDEWSVPSIHEEILMRPYSLKAFSFLRNCPWASDGVKDAQDSHILLAPRGGAPESTNIKYIQFVKEGEDGYVACLPKQRETGLFVPQIISETFDPTRAKLWVQNCRDTHESTCNENCEAIHGLRAIDCETLRIVHIETGALWVALSYVWGHDISQVRSDDLQTGTLPRGISKTVQHAIEVTKGLGYRFLWVDRYCINQQDERDKCDLISKMDMIYRGADLTIVAAAGDDEHFGLPGVGTTERKKQKVIELDCCTILSTGPDPVYETKRSRWWSRGWTFQEGLLSRRRLIFTEHQSWFECYEEGWMEALGGLELLKHPEAQLAQASRKIGKSLNAWFLSYYRLLSVYYDELERFASGKIISRLQQMSLIIRAYSERNLTFDRDSLNAIAGVYRYFRHADPPVAHVFGIPFIPSLMSPSGREAAERFMFYFLSWFHLKDAAPRRRQHFPSWTWAGWAGPVDFMADVGLEYGQSIMQGMRHLRFEVNGQVIPQETYLKVFNSVQCPSPELEIALCFQAQTVPSSLFLWNTYLDTWLSEESRGSNKSQWSDESQGSNDSPPNGQDHFTQGGTTTEDFFWLLSGWTVDWRIV